jgi:hypothetical protein
MTVTAPGLLPQSGTHCGLLRHGHGAPRPRPGEFCIMVLQWLSHQLWVHYWLLCHACPKFCIMALPWLSHQLWVHYWFLCHGCPEGGGVASRPRPPTCTCAREHTTYTHTHSTLCLSEQIMHSMPCCRSLAHGFVQAVPTERLVHLLPCCRLLLAADVCQMGRCALSGMALASMSRPQLSLRASRQA